MNKADTLHLKDSRGGKSMKRFRIIVLFLITAALALLLSVPAFATDPTGENTQPYDADAWRVWLTNSCYYDSTTREFCYPIEESGTEVRANVADGMIVTEPVSVKGVTLLIYRDGERWEGDPTSITEPGEYVVMAQVGNQTPRMFTFTLAGIGVSTVYSYNLPAGMYVIEATRDEMPIAYERASVPMQEDGLYHVVYECIAAETVYELNLNVDRTPPEIEFSGEIDENHRVHSALSFSGLQEGDTIRVLLDGVPVDVAVNPDGSGVLPDSGNYIITVFDAAGNSTEYGYIVMLYLNAGSLGFFLLLAATGIAVIVYIFIKRKRLEIG